MRRALRPGAASPSCTNRSMRQSSSRRPATAELAQVRVERLPGDPGLVLERDRAASASRLPGVDVEDVLGILHAIGASSRVNGEPGPPEILSYLKAGCGYGGSCLPKDLSALIAARPGRPSFRCWTLCARSTRRSRCASSTAAEGRFVGLDGRSVAVLGVAFKGGTDDLRASPGLRIVDRLLDRGARDRRRPARHGGPARPDVGRGVRVESTRSGDRRRGGRRRRDERRGVRGARRARARARRVGAAVVDGRRALAPESFASGYIGVGRQSQ